MFPRIACSTSCCGLLKKNKFLLSQNAQLKQQLTLLDDELNRQLQDVRNEKEWLASLINSISDEIWFADAGKKIVLANPAALRGLGVEASEFTDIEQFVGKFEVYNGDGSPRLPHEAPALRALNGEYIKNAEELLRASPSAELKLRQLSASPVKDRSGKIIGAVCVIRDITGQRVLEEGKRAIMELLSLINSSASKEELLEKAVRFFRDWFGCDAVTLRLEGKPPTVSACPELGAQPRGLRTSAKIPLQDGSRPLGHLELKTRLRNPFGAGQIDLLEYLGTKLSMALSSLRVQGEIQRSYAEMERTVQERTRELVAINAALKRANRGLSALRKCDDLLVHCATETELLQGVCKIIQGVDGAKMAWVGYKGENGAVIPVASAGDDGGYVAGMRIVWVETPRGRGPTGSAIRTQTVVVCNDIESDPRLKPWRRELLRRGFRASIALPLVCEEECLGALNICAPEAGAFNHEYVEMLKLLASDLTYGIVTLRARAEREQLQRELLIISEREKQMFSQELHDGLCQSLAGTAMLQSLLHKRLAAMDDRREEAQYAGQIAKMLGSNVDEARNLAHGLHPVGPEPLGLIDALRLLVRTVGNLFHIRCVFLCPKLILIHDETASTHLFRIVQEAINNARKHGEAASVIIRLHSTREGVLLSVRDNGCGLPAVIPQGGLGMRIMKHRAREIGARLVIRRAGKRGTEVRCLLPHNGLATIGEGTTPARPSLEAPSKP
ncbi:MAG: GAF domain-containing protein [Chthoniobacteraceae bacterium]